VCCLLLCYRRDSRDHALLCSAGTPARSAAGSSGDSGAAADPQASADDCDGGSGVCERPAVGATLPAMAVGRHALTCRALARRTADAFSDQLEALRRELDRRAQDGEMEAVQWGAGAQLPQECRAAWHRCVPCAFSPRPYPTPLSVGRGRRLLVVSAHVGAPAPAIDAPCKQCLRHGDPIKDSLCHAVAAQAGGSPQRWSAGLRARIRWAARALCQLFGGVPAEIRSDVMYGCG
jgi:hypothetical protein